MSRIDRLNEPTNDRSIDLEFHFFFIKQNKKIIKEIRIFFSIIIIIEHKEHNNKK